MMAQDYVCIAPVRLCLFELPFGQGLMPDMWTVAWSQDSMPVGELIFQST